MHIPDNTVSVLHTVHKLVLKTFLDAILTFLLLAIKKHTKNKMSSMCDCSVLALQNYVPVYRKIQRNNVCIKMPKFLTPLKITFHRSNLKLNITKQ